MKDEEIRDLFCKPGDERALISYSLKRIDHFYSICSKMNEDDFLYPDHKMIFILMKTLLSKDIKKFDVSMVIDEAKSNGVLQNIGNYDYLESISRMSLDKSNINVYIDNVLEASTKYKLYVDLNYGLENIVENSTTSVSSEDLIGAVESRIMDLSTKAKSIREPRDFGDGLDEYIEERKENPVEMCGLSTGFTILNTQIDGLVPGTLNIVSARKKMGKSTFLSNIAAHAAYKERISVLYVDTEMTFEEWRNRIIAMISGVDERVIKHGGYIDEDYNRIKQSLEIVKKGRLFHQYMPGYSIGKLTALYKKYKIKEHIGLGVFDYIKEPAEGVNADRRRAEWQILGDVTTKLKDLAGELEIPFLAAVQINREGGVAGSDRISWFGDVVMQWMYKTKDEIDMKGFEGGQYKLVVRDTRRGGGTPEEGIGFRFRKKSLEIKEVPTEHQIIIYGEDVVDYASDDNEELI